MDTITGIKNHINKISGQSIFRIGRASDMLWIQFGKSIIVKNYKGIEVEKGEYAIHVQCPWRFCRQDKIILGSRDIFIPCNGVSEQEFNWDISGMSIFDNKCKTINEGIAPIVKEAKVDGLGTLKIIFDNELVFEAITDSKEEIEFWRFINNNTKEHIVVFE